MSITGYGQPSDKLRAREAGFDDHLVKPVDLGVIEQVIADVRARAKRRTDRGERRRRYACRVNVALLALAALIAADGVVAKQWQAQTHPDDRAGAVDRHVQQRLPAGRRDAARERPRL